LLSVNFYWQGTVNFLEIKDLENCETQGKSRSVRAGRPVEKTIHPSF